jgi:hypothetical protein
VAIRIFSAAQASALPLDLSRCLEHIATWESLAYAGQSRSASQLANCISVSATTFFLAFEGEELVGYLDLWQLKSDFFERLQLGLELEESISSEVIFPSERRLSGLWYVGSVICKYTIERIAGTDARSAFVFSALIRELGIHFGSSHHMPSNLISVGSKVIGVKALKKWGFQLVQIDDHAVDIRPRYTKALENSNDSSVFFLRRRSVRPNLS